MGAGIEGGYCGCPGPVPNENGEVAAFSDPIINGSGQNAFGNFTAQENFGAHLLHESGHFFHLTHTFGGADCGTNKASTLQPADDEIPTTLPDISCWTIDEMSLYYFGANYSALTDSTQIWLVSNTYSNLMSYHERMGFPILTEEQLDRWSDAANGYRSYVVSGTTIYVTPSGNDGNTGTQTANPKRTVYSAVGAASDHGADIVLLRPGFYDEQLSIHKPVTLRATRSGWATIGRP